MSSDKSLTNRIWREKEISSNLIESFSQKKSISQLYSKLLLCREINEDNFDQFINPDILNNLPVLSLIIHTKFQVFFYNFL